MAVHDFETRYQIVGQIGAGGMGEVMLARHTGPGGFEKLVVIKRLLRHLDQQPGSIRQFLNEARLVALFSHPNIVQVFELGEHEGTYSIVMEHVHGRSLRAVLRALRGRPRLPIAVALQLAMEVLRGLDYVHQLKHEGLPLHLVHRDVTPENVLVSFSGAVKLVDFGIARASILESTTKPNTVKGKLAYMAPEAFTGTGPVCATVDLYSVAVVLCECLLGVNPFRGETEMDTAANLLVRELPRLRELRSDLPLAIEQVLNRALEREVARRFPTAAEFLEALEGAGGPTRASPEQLRALMVSLFGEGAADDPTEGLTRVEPTKPLAKVTLQEGRARAPAPWWRPVWRPLLLGVLLVGGFATAYWVAARSKELAPQAPPPTAMTEVRPPSPPPVVSDGVIPPLAFEPTLVDPRTPPLTFSFDGAPTRVPPDAGAAPPPPRAKSGLVWLYVKPWAEVSWRGRKLGLTPLDRPLELPAGRQVLVLKNRPLSLVREVTVEVRAGRTVTQKVNLLGP